MTTILLHDAMVMCLSEADTLYERGYVLIEDDRIAAVGDVSALPENHTVDESIDCVGKLIMPGLVNAHTHTPMTLFRGLAEGVSLFTLDGWYNSIRVLELAMTADMIAASVEVACAEMIRTGTTTFADQYFYMDEIIPVVDRSGMRAALAYGVVELGDAAAREQELNQLEQFLEEIGGHPNDKLSGWIGPHAFFVDNSPEMMARERILAAKYQTGMHIHLSTTGEEDVYCQERYGTSAVEQLEAMQMFDRPMIAAHSITIPPDDWPILAAHEFTAVIAASACMRAGAEAAPVVGMRDAGINIAIGTDNVCNNNDYDLFSEMRTLAKLTSFREKQPSALTAREVLDMATSGGAQALGLQDEIGDLTPGKKADLILLDRNGIGWSPFPTNRVYDALVYSINGLQVSDAMVDGRWLLRDRQWMTLDYHAATQRQAADVERLLTRVDARDSTAL
ncbi:MAG: amidohydrolase [Chloroflexi bacterium]|nr:MAG: amidohydrolase [Chloroflexota bacterium]